jgi:hypothetical protein
MTSLRTSLLQENAHPVMRLVRRSLSLSVSLDVLPNEFLEQSAFPVVLVACNGYATARYTASIAA